MVYFLRHGKTARANMDKISVTEASTTIALSEEGEKQIRNVKIPQDLDVIVVSDSLRTIQSAEIIVKANRLSIPIKVEKELHPWKSGSDDWDTYYDRFQDFCLNYDSHAPYESKQSMRNRVQSVINKYHEQNILVIAHSILLANYLRRDFLDYAELVQVM